MIKKLTRERKLTKAGEQCRQSLEKKKKQIKTDEIIKNKTKYKKNQITNRCI